LFEPGEKEVRNPAIAMAMRRIAMCEQAGTGMRMMREEWQKLGHPIPIHKNDRAWKAFEFFIPGLDKEVDMASDLMKAMFGGTGQAAGQVTEQVGRIMEAVGNRVLTGQEIMERLGLSHRPTFLYRYLQPALEAELIEMTVPGKPRSSKQKYRLTKEGRQFLNGVEGAPK
ncbi:MAG: ATP-binding protein, partial [Pseudomonadota bacterium]